MLKSILIQFYAWIDFGSLTTLKGIIPKQGESY